MTRKNGHKSTMIKLSLSLAGVSLVASGCGQQPPSNSASGSGSVSKTTTISFMEVMSSGKLQTAMKSLTSQFEKSHPNIQVNLVPEPSYSVLETKIEAVVAAGDPPTMAQAYESWANGYAQAGAIIPLTSFVSGKDGISASAQKDFWPQLWQDQFLPDGKMWMLPFNKSDFVMYYNQNMLTAQHLSVPTTWTQFSEVCQHLTNTAQNHWGVSIDPGSASGASNGTYLYVALIRAFGGHLMQNGKPDFNSPQAQQAMQYLLHLYQSGALKLGTNYPGQTALGAGHSGFDLSTIASYYYNEQAIGGKFKMGVAALPQGPAGQGNVMQGTNLVIFSKATPTQQQAAWTFMKWLTEPQQTAYWASHTGYLPVRQSAIPLMSSYYATHPYQKIAADALAEAKPTPPYVGMDQAIAALGNALQAVLTDHTPIPVALSKAQTQAEAALSGQPS